MEPLSYEEMSQLCKPTTSYFGDGRWGRNPVAICDWCKRKTDSLRIRMKGVVEQLVCTRCVEESKK